MIDAYVMSKKDEAAWDMAIRTLRSLSDVNLPSATDHAVCDMLTVLDNLAFGHLGDDVRDEVKALAKKSLEKLHD